MLKRILKVRSLRLGVRGWLFISACCPLSIACCFSQVTKITGIVYDAQTREPLPFVNMKYKGVNVFTTTDVDGKFSLSTITPADTIIISYIGYKTKKIKIQKNTVQSKNIELEPDQVALQEVVILPGENPAHRILRKVIEHKDANDRDNLSSYEYEVYNKIEFDLNNIPPEWKKRRVMKPIKFVFDYIDSTSVTEKPYLPLLLSESISDFYYTKSPQHKKEIIKASKLSGVDESSISQFMGEMYQNVDIYHNNIVVFGKQFPSPISDHALAYYKFYLIDSVYIGSHRCYQLQFKQKRTQEICFSGNMWIADTSFAVKRLEMSLPDKINLNFVKALNVVQEYEPVDSVWMLSRDRLVVDFKMDEQRKKSKQPGFYGRKTTSYRNFIINRPHSEDFYSKGEDIMVLDSANKKDDAFWVNARHDTLSKDEKQIYKMVDTIKTLPVYRTWYDWILLITTGYKPIGKFEFGPYNKLYSYNLVEGNRFRLGIRTSDAFSKWYEFNGYAAYGVKDDKLKYGIGFRSFVTKKPRQIVSINYKDDLEVLGQSTNAFSQDNGLAAIFRRRPLSSLTAIQQLQTSYEWEPFQGLNNKFILTHKIMSPKGDQVFHYVSDANDTLSQNNIIASEVSAIIRFAYHEKYLEGTFSRRSMGTRYPVLQLQYTEGLSGVWGSQYHYRKASLMINDRIRINPLLGYFDYIIQGGKIWGAVPFPLLELHGGNETVIYDPYAYNMMNYYEFASDQYLTIQAFYHFGGFFLNHIPLMRKLNWREVVSGKYLVGSVSSKNNNLLIFPNTLTSLYQGPYYETSAGIENIFKIFRIDAVWRLSYIDKNYINDYASKGGGKIPIFGIRWTLQVTF